MRVLFTGGSICQYSTLQRLILVADEIGFMDRPSVMFGQWGFVGRDSEIRQFNNSNLPIVIGAHKPPSGRVRDLFERYIESDLSNPAFVQTFFAGLSNS